MKREGYLFVRHGSPSSRMMVSFGRKPTPLTCRMYLPVDVRTTRQEVRVMAVVGPVAATHEKVTSYPNVFG